jgi:phosphoribosylaminoimidazole-succinocarboxamide synthase
VSEPRVVYRSELPLPLVARGKVRDLYDAGEDRLLLVATDRLSAFDVVLPQPVPWKGIVLTQLSAWWFTRIADVTPHHLITADPERIATELPAIAGHAAALDGRAALVRRARVAPIEAVVRGYLAGSAWAEYHASGTLAGEPLPADLRQNAALPAPIFSPATKAVSGHDENITFDEAARRVGRGVAETMRERSLRIYERGRQIAGRAGIIVADTKFEFGYDAAGALLLIDEVLTPDSSRFWPATSYVVGTAQPSLDKQPVRDHLEELVRSGQWNREPPAPTLPDAVVAATSRRYRELFERLTGHRIERFPMHDPLAASPVPDTSDGP